MNKYNIIPGAMPLKEGGFQPSVMIHFFFGNEIIDRPLDWKQKFDDEEEAKKFALSAAEKYLNDVGYVDMRNPREWIVKTSINPEALKK